MHGSGFCEEVHVTYSCLLEIENKDSVLDRNITSKYAAGGWSGLKI